MVKGKYSQYPLRAPGPVLPPHSLRGPAEIEDVSLAFANFCRLGDPKDKIEVFLKENHRPARQPREKSGGPS